VRITSTQKAILENSDFKATSTKYRPIKTIDVINRFKSHGLKVSSMEESRTRDVNKQDKVRHFVRMTIDEQQGIKREVVIMNSSDSTTSLRLHAGVLRLVCNNGLIFSDDLIPAEKIKHTHHNPFTRIDEFVDRLLKALDEEQQVREAMMSKMLSQNDIAHFARKAIKLAEKDYSKVLDPLAVTIVQRPEDLGKDLWVVYNVIQENIMQGNYRKSRERLTEDGDIQEYFSSAHKITDKSRAMQFNIALHALAMEVLHNRMYS